MKIKYSKFDIFMLHHKHLKGIINTKVLCISTSEMPPSDYLLVEIRFVGFSGHFRGKREKGEKYIFRVSTSIKVLLLNPGRHNNLLEQPLAGRNTQHISLKRTLSHNFKFFDM